SRAPPGSPLAPSTTPFRSTLATSWQRPLLPADPGARGRQQLPLPQARWGGRGGRGGGGGGRGASGRRAVVGQRRGGGGRGPHCSSEEHTSALQSLDQLVCR